MKTLKIFLSLTLSSCLLFASCIDADIDEAVDYDDYYSTANDADAAILGLYGKVMELAAPVVVLNELRGDLLDVTDNASLDLQQINLNNPGKDNQWSNVTKFYNVIQNCNDILYNYNKMLAENKLTREEYNERYSDVGAIRCWVYYQLGVQFGSVPYITEPVVDIKDLAKYQDNVLTLSQLTDELIRFMEGLPTLEPYRTSKLITGSVDGYSLLPFFINKKCLLGDLYLFKGAGYYEKAAKIYRDVLRVGEDEPATARLQQRTNRLYIYVWSGGTVDYFQVLTDRYKPDDASLAYNAWKGMFSGSADNAGVRDEMIWEMSYDYRYAPQYPFVEMFSNQGQGKYYLKPSTYAVEELWGSENQKNGTPFDARGLTGGIEETPSGDYLVSKYSLTYDALNKPFEVSGKWYLYRSALLHLRYAEAANRAGWPRLAWAIINDGFGPNCSAFVWRNAAGNVCRGDSIRQSAWGPMQNYPEPYDFDGREINQPYLRSPWRNNGGVRGRANLPNVTLPAGISKQDSMALVEKMIIREAALELGFEGHRWTDLIRFARRYQAEGALTTLDDGIIYANGSDFLNKILSGKYQKAGTAVPDFGSEDKWYLPFYNE
ncbi:RagB/SusD family nutrient uptake outer membrane protein [Viscerimonas tarda]